MLHWYQKDSDPCMPRIINCRREKTMIACVYIFALNLMPGDDEAYL